MSHRSATQTDPIATGVIAGELAALDASGAPPAWIKIAPRGRVTTRDGRSYGFDPASLVARFQADGISIPVDLDHSVPRKAMFGEAGTVVGWVPELEARTDGLWARVDWLDAGKQTLSARTHRFVSPTFHHDDAGNATWLHSVALVPAPALAMPAVASAGPTTQKDQPMLKKIAAALGLTETADEGSCLSAIAGLKADTVSKAIHEQTLANLAAVTTAKDAAEAKIADLGAEAHKKAVEDLLDGALQKKKITPAQRGEYALLCATASGLEQVRALLEKTPANLQASALGERETPSGEATINATTLAAKAVAYQKKMAADGVFLSTADAVMAVKEGKQ
ncbi:Uncharacterised protein [Starkeya nomas]|uniref:Mu-like prophage I protein n=1 Tax=Starkeya nomas TaxID=2666134 RepID=A0A5S9PC28_9HYPH|nr:phage protease [Starkeya nomas]CAA0101242.1 Uncharacterised protein [Starkeya nomas]